jgi:Uma2 family endonuclease
MASVTRMSFITPEEYLERERTAPYKNEYRDGRVHAMSGASRKHNLISINLASELNLQLRGRPCEVYVGDMRVRVKPANLYTYPDIVAVCGTPQFTDDHVDTLVNPLLIIEVLSPSTQGYDRAEKFASYQRIESFREYVLIAQDRVHIERYCRDGGQWSSTSWDSLDAILALDSIGCVVPIRNIYDKLGFEEGLGPGA